MVYHNMSKDKVTDEETLRKIAERAMDDNKVVFDRLAEL